MEYSAHETSDKGLSEKRITSGQSIIISYVPKVIFSHRNNTFLYLLE